MVVLFWSTTMKDTPRMTILPVVILGALSDLPLFSSPDYWWDELLQLAGAAYWC
jgi:hypothetical protein